MRTNDMWQEAGIQFRSNLFTEVGDDIALHRHSFDHVAIVHGWVLAREIAPDGSEKQYQLASRGFTPTRMDIEFKPVSYKVSIPAFHQHSFEVLELHSGVAEVLCIFPVNT